ncbi:MAG: E3 binding domain-containing protein [Anaerolineae bacterium]|nr:MAG: E3 binding domain-containing protein [Anaerolineae bacterium]
MGHRLSSDRRRSRGRGPGAVPAAAGLTTAPVVTTPDDSAPAGAAPPRGPSALPPSTARRPPSSPAARRLARELDLDWTQATGTGARSHSRARHPALGDRTGRHTGRGCRHHFSPRPPACRASGPRSRHPGTALSRPAHRARTSKRRCGRC